MTRPAVGRRGRRDIFTPFPSNQGKIEGLAPLAAVFQACAKSGVDYTLTEGEGVQKIFGELVAGLPLAPDK